MRRKTAKWRLELQIVVEPPVAPAIERLFERCPWRRRPSKGVPESFGTPEPEPTPRPRTKRRRRRQVRHNDDEPTPVPSAPLPESNAERLARECRESMRNDNSHLGFRPTDDEWFEELTDDYYEIRTRAYAESTLQRDCSHWKRWVQFCAKLGTPFIRDDVAANMGIDIAGYARERRLVALFVLHTIRTMAPRTKTDPCPCPESARNTFAGVRRRHAIETDGIQLIETKEVSIVIKAMLRIFVEKHGADVLAQDRKEPMRRSILLNMLALPNGTKIGSQVLI